MLVMVPVSANVKVSMKVLLMRVMVLMPADGTTKVLLPQVLGMVPVSAIVTMKGALDACYGASISGCDSNDGA